MRKPIPFILILSLALTACVPQAEAGVPALSTSGGYITEYGGYYYFANPDDQNRLYRMDANLQNPEMLSSQANASRRLEIRVSGGRLYYLQIRDSGLSWPPLVNTLCCYDPETGTETRLSERNVLSYAVTDEFLYYSTLAPISLRRMRPDGSDDVALTDEHHGDRSAHHDLQVRGTRLLYACGEAVTELALEDMTFRSVPGYAYAMLVYRGDVYSINFNAGMRLERFDADRLAFRRARAGGRRVRVLHPRQSAVLRRPGRLHLFREPERAREAFSRERFLPHRTVGAAVLL